MFLLENKVSYLRAFQITLEKSTDSLYMSNPLLYIKTNTQKIGFSSRKKPLPTTKSNQDSKYDAWNILK
jgi:hypothetical protein